MIWRPSAVSLWSSYCLEILVVFTKHGPLHSDRQKYHHNQTLTTHAHTRTHTRYSTVCDQSGAALGIWNPDPYCSMYVQAAAGIMDKQYRRTPDPLLLKVFD